jgi:serine/threonine-protein kinase
MGTNIVVDGRYRAHRILGQGAMGTVYSGQHIALGRPVAIKVLRSALRGQKGREQRLVREARLAGSLGHPNICVVHDLGWMEDGSPYVIMELLVGVTLARLLRSEGPLPFEHAQAILCQVLSALAVAHRAGIIHRDIKPANIFVTRDPPGYPHAKVLDFGLAKTPNSPTDTCTSPGIVLGTPSYMAPEQFLGIGVDPRADIYACGAVAYEMLTGKPPFDGLTYDELSRAVAVADPTDPRALRPRLPDTLASGVLQALAKRPSQRFASCADFLAFLSGPMERPAPAPSDGWDPLDDDIPVTLDTSP